MVLNPKQKFEPAIFAYIHLPGAIPWLPGVVDQAIAASQLLLVTGLIGAFWIASDLATSERWRTRVWWTMSLTGVSLVALGLTQRVTGARAIFWDPVADTGTTFFATYRYHGNAGAFLNLVLPLIAAQALLAFTRRSSHAGMAFWSIATLMVAAGVFINVSKAAMGIATLILLVLACQQLKQREFGNRSKAKWAVTRRRRRSSIFRSALGLWFRRFIEPVGRVRHFRRRPLSMDGRRNHQSAMPCRLPVGGDLVREPFRLLSHFSRNSLGIASPAFGKMLIKTISKP